MGIPVKLEVFEGPLDLLLHLIEKNKVDIYDIPIVEITNQYMEYIRQMQREDLNVMSEFLVMASTLLYMKSRSLLPRQEEEKELTEDELIRRIMEYKQYKEITKRLKENYDIYSKRFFKFAEDIELPKQKLEKNYEKEAIPKCYSNIVQRNEEKINQNAKNIEKIAIIDHYTVASKVKEMFRELVKRPRFIFNKLFSLNKCNKQEVVTAFSGLLELSRRNKVTANQEIIFGDIIVEKTKKEG